MKPDAFAIDLAAAFAVTQAVLPDVPPARWPEVAASIIGSVLGDRAQASAPDLSPRRLPAATHLRLIQND